MKKLTTEWEELKHFFPEGWEEKARESKAICRTRKISSAEELLRVKLLHFGEGLSLKETSAVAKEGGISDISSVALYHWMRKSGEWLEGYRVRAIDGSYIREQGNTGSYWILHYSWEIFGLRNDYFEITPNSQGESVLRFPIEKNDIILADRHYGKAKAFDYVVQSGGDFVMRLKHKAANYFDENARKVDLLTLLRPLKTGEVLDTTLYYRFGKKVDALLKPLCICAIRKSKEQAERILELYRFRWQVELAFKRLKSIMQLGQFPRTDPESCRAWLYGKMLYALLCYAIVDKGRFFPRGVFMRSILKPTKVSGGNCLSPCSLSVRRSDRIWVLLPNSLTERVWLCCLQKLLDNESMLLVVYLNAYGVCSPEADACPVPDIITNPKLV